MLNIKVLGSGCANCKQVEKLVHSAIDFLNIEAEVSKVTDPTKYADFGVMMTPGLVINGQAVCSGRVPTMGEVTSFITTALDSA